MAKSYKIKDDNYIDSSGIMHNRENLKTKLNNFFNFSNYTNWNINTNYIPNKNGFTRFDVNSIFCFANLNFKITAQAPIDTVLLSNLPKPKNRITFCAALDSTLVRLYIDTNGELRADGNVSVTGWLNCNISYLLV